jgi:hypothetical protein
VDIFLAILVLIAAIRTDFSRSCHRPRDFTGSDRDGFGTNWRFARSGSGTRRRMILATGRTTLIPPAVWGAESAADKLFVIRSE